MSNLSRIIDYEILQSIELVEHTFFIYIEMRFDFN